MHIRSRDILVPQTEHNRPIDNEEPHIARETVEHSSDKGLLARESRHLSVGGVAEVGEHQQQYATDVMPQVGIVEHEASPHPQEDGEYSDDIRMDVELIPQQGECQSDGTGEMDIEPLLRKTISELLYPDAHPQRGL